MKMETFRYKKHVIEQIKEKVMTKYSFLIGLATLSIWTTACKSSNNDPTDSGNPADPPVDDTGPAPDVDEVYSASTFTVDIQSDEVYGQGQTHSNWNTPNPTEMDLKLDLYVPENEDTQRPLVVFTHGGGWSGGDKANDAEVAFCNFFAERGFVCASINYRLRGYHGTVLEERRITCLLDLRRGQKIYTDPSGELHTDHLLFATRDTKCPHTV